MPTKTYLVCTPIYDSFEEYLVDRARYVPEQDCELIEAPNKREAIRLGYHALKDGEFYRDFERDRFNPFAPLTAQEIEIEDDDDA